MNNNNNMKSKLSKILFLFVVLLSVAGCSLFEEGKGSLKNGDKVVEASEQITRYTGEKSEAISSVYTTNRELSLTFNGMADDQTMELLLDELDLHGIKATFFLPGIRVAEEPDLAKKVLSKGHEIENNTLNQLDMSELSYEQIYKEIQLGNEIIEQETGVVPRYVRTKSGDYNDDIRLVTAQLGMDAVVSYNINPKDWDMKDAKSIGEYVERYISRGGDYFPKH